MRILAQVFLIASCLIACIQYPENPPVAHTGGFGEPTCHACHFDGALNDDIGDLRVLGFEESYVPGETYSLSVLLKRQGMNGAGFQLSIRTEDGVQAGVLGAADERTGIDTSKNIEYIRHSLEGADEVHADSALWTFNWTAPDSIAPLVVHVVANAANGDASEFGDAIYQRTLQIRASQNSEAKHRR